MSKSEDKRAVLSKGNRGQLQVRQPFENEFTDDRKAEFLDLFSETCNVTKAAEKVGVHRSNVYRHRRKDAAFREGWKVAQAQAYAELEAALVRRACALLDGGTPGHEAEEPLSGMDAKLAFAVLQNFQKTIGREPGDIRPRRSDLAEATKRLEKVMASMKLIPAEDIASEDE